jgi:hypothetical protein
VNPAEIAELLPRLTDDERRELEGLLALPTGPLWSPLHGPQTVAYESKADVLGYGGSAGGGKTDLLLGLALTRHRNSAIFRREATQLNAIIDRMTELLGGSAGLNRQTKIWRLPDRKVSFGSTPHPGDETAYQGQPKDLLGLDEATNFLESQARFLMGWVRTTTPGQPVRTVMAFNPPTNAEGRWVIRYFAPWLDDMHPNPAQPGELRWFAVIDGEDVEVDGPEPFERNGQPIKPHSRTFVPARLSDNPYLMATGYEQTLMALPEPLRSQMLYGDFRAGLEDDPFQVIPTKWIDAAMARWKPRHELARDPGEMDSIGVDVAAGGKDREVIARRHGVWFDELRVFTGQPEPDGALTGSRVLALRKDNAVVHVDVVGPGGPTHGWLSAQSIQSVGVNGASPTLDRTADGAALKLYNLRSLIWWRLRELLDPSRPDPAMLPPDRKLRADLAAPRWSHGPSGIKVEAKAETRKRIGRSPDRGDAVVYAAIDTIKAGALQQLMRSRGRHLDYDPRD